MKTSNIVSKLFITLILTLVVCAASVTAQERSGCPKRIVSMNLASDEILIDLVDKSRIAGLTYLSADPALSNVSDKVGGVNATVRADLEQIVNLQPDLVIMAKFSQIDIAKQLWDAGIKTTVIEHFESIEGIKKNIVNIGKEVCEVEKAAALVNEMETELAKIAKKLTEKLNGATKKPTVLYFSPAGFTAGGNSIVGDIIEYAGGVNVVAAAGINGNKQVSLEFIVTLDPEVIVMSSYSPDNPEFAMNMVRESVLREVRAVKTGRVYPLEDKQLIGASHYVVNGVKVVFALLHPELNRRPEPNK